MIPSSRPKLSDLYILSQSKLLENHTLHSDTYLFYFSEFFLPGTSLQEFFPLEISLQDIYLLKSPIPPLQKVVGHFALMFSRKGKHTQLVAVYARFSGSHASSFKDTSNFNFNRVGVGFKNSSGERNRHGMHLK